MSFKPDNLQRLINIVEKLRSPGGCPWDREQTHQSLRQNLIEETYEAVDAIESGNEEHLKEELGDVLLQVVLHSQIASEDNGFTLDDVAKDIADKLVRRHPHVFADTKVKDSAEVVTNWEAIKKKEKPERISALAGVTSSQPALMYSLDLSKKAVKVGFEWPNEESLWECFYSEIEEFKESVEKQNMDEMEEEFGDILFSLVNAARWHKINPELALRKACNKFKGRFQLMEEIAGQKLDNYSQGELEEFWKLAKSKL